MFDNRDKLEQQDNFMFSRVVSPVGAMHFIACMFITLFIPLLLPPRIPIPDSGTWQRKPVRRVNIELVSRGHHDANSSKTDDRMYWVHADPDGYDMSLEELEMAGMLLHTTMDPYSDEELRQMLNHKHHYWQGKTMGHALLSGVPLYIDFQAGMWFPTATGVEGDEHKARQQVSVVRRRTTIRYLEHTPTTLFSDDDDTSNASDTGNCRRTSRRQQPSTTSRVAFQGVPLSSTANDSTRETVRIKVDNAGRQLSADETYEMVEKGDNDWLFFVHEKYPKCFQVSYEDPVKKDTLKFVKMKRCHRDRGTWNSNGEGEWAASGCEWILRKCKGVVLDDRCDDFDAYFSRVRDIDGKRDGLALVWWHGGSVAQDDSELDLLGGSGLDQREVDKTIWLMRHSVRMQLTLLHKVDEAKEKMYRPWYGPLWSWRARFSSDFSGLTSRSLKHRARRYVEIRLAAPALAVGGRVHMPYSGAFALYIFIGQTFQYFWKLITFAYHIKPNIGDLWGNSRDWFPLTFRAELVLPVVLYLASGLVTMFRQYCFVRFVVLVRPQLEPTAGAILASLMAIVVPTALLICLPFFLFYLPVLALAASLAFGLWSVVARLVTWYYGEWDKYSQKSWREALQSLLLHHSAQSLLIGSPLVLIVLVLITLSVCVKSFFQTQTYICTFSHWSQSMRFQAGHSQSPEDIIGYAASLAIIIAIVMLVFGVLALIVKGAFPNAILDFWLRNPFEKNLSTLLGWQRYVHANDLGPHDIEADLARRHIAVQLLQECAESLKELSELGEEADERFASPRATP